MNSGPPELKREPTTRSSSNTIGQVPCSDPGKGVIYALDTDSNKFKQLADIEEEVYGPLSVSEGVVYIHTQDLTLHRVNAKTGAVLMSISLKSKE